MSSLKHAREEDNEHDKDNNKHSKLINPFLDIPQAIVLYYLWPLLSSESALALIRVSHDTANHLFRNMSRRFPLYTLQNIVSSPIDYYNTMSFDDTYSNHIVVHQERQKFNTPFPIPISYHYCRKFTIEENEGYPFVLKFEQSDVFDPTFFRQIPQNTSWCFPVQVCATLECLSSVNGLRDTKTLWVKEGLEESFLLKYIFQLSTHTNSITTLILDHSESDGIINALVQYHLSTQITSLHLLSEDANINGNYIEHFDNLQVLECLYYPFRHENPITFPRSLHTIIYNSSYIADWFPIKECLSLRTFVWKSIKELSCKCLPTSLTTLISCSHLFPGDLVLLENLEELTLLMFESIYGQLHELPSSLKRLSMPLYHGNIYELPLSTTNSLQILHIPDCEYDPKTHDSFLRHIAPSVTVIANKFPLGITEQINEIDRVTLQYLINHPEYLKHHFVFKWNERLLTYFCRYFEKQNVFVRRHIGVNVNEIVDFLKIYCWDVFDTDFL